MLLKAL